MRKTEKGQMSKKKRQCDQVCALTLEYIVEKFGKSEIVLKPKHDEQQKKSTHNTEKIYRIKCTLSMSENFGRNDINTIRINHK